MDEETSYKLLKLLEERPNLSQRDLARMMGISLGKVNYCLKALVGKGMVKARNFYNSNNKSAYAYLLTAKGIEEKAEITMRFLKRKLTEYEELQHEIEELRKEVGQQKRDQG